MGTSNTGSPNAVQELLLTVLLECTSAKQILLFLSGSWWQMLGNNSEYFHSLYLASAQLIKQPKQVKLIACDLCVQVDEEPEEPEDAAEEAEQDEEELDADAEDSDTQKVGSQVSCFLANIYVHLNLWMLPGKKVHFAFHDTRC